MENEVIGEVLVSLSAEATKEGKAPDWIKIAPRGPTETRDGRKFTFVPEALAARFARDKTDVPMDIDHTIHKAAERGHRANAVGWIERMESRDDGLYGKVDWLSEGTAALSARTHRYVSPTFLHNGDGAATWVHSVSLVTAPALSNMPALASANGNRNTGTINAEILTALSLPANATSAQALAEIDRLRRADDGAMTEMVAQLAAAKNETKVRRIDERIEKAFKEGTLLPFQRDWARRAALNDEEGFFALLDSLGNPYAHIVRPYAGEWVLRESPLPNEYAHSVAAQLGIDPKKLAKGTE